MALAAERYPPQPGCEAPYPAGARLPPRAPQPAPKDYSVPLHVDCSVEYELPDCAKPPQGVKIEPLLMIHPAHFRRLDSLRRCPFVNNLPAASGGRAAYELPAPPAARPRARAPRAREPERWPAERCCEARYRAGTGGYQPDPRWGACGGPEPCAPKEGDTLENSFGKCPQQKYRSARQRTHPYAPEPGTPGALGTLGALGAHTALAQNCDKTFEMLQGNRLISPFHAKMFSGEGVYQNYPIVMYK